MSEQILSILKRRLDELSDQGDPEVHRNALKEVLQLYILNFIYHHPQYSNWVMYGGSALRIVHGLDRMSVDLDFEVSHTVTKAFLQKLRGEIEHHFTKTYNAGSDFFEAKIKGTRGLTLKFHIGKSLDLGLHSKQVRVEIDLNHFAAPKTVIERRPINEGQLSFVILTYNMSGLMASKIAAIFLREERGIDANTYEYKGRDIYDLLWYMGKGVIPDLDYLNAKLKAEDRRMSDIKALFDEITTAILNYEKMDELLEQDLFPLFMNRSFIKNWIGNWRESYLRRLEEYKIQTVTELDRIVIDRDFFTDNYSFIFWYHTGSGGIVRIICTVSDYWIEFREGDLPIEIDENLNCKIQLSRNWTPSTEPSDRLRKYATLFYQKVEEYFKKTNQVMLGRQFATKVIRMTADNFNPREQIILSPSALLSCELEDLLQ